MHFSAPELIFESRKYTFVNMHFADKNVVWFSSKKIHVSTDFSVPAVFICDFLLSSKLTNTL